MPIQSNELLHDDNSQSHTVKFTQEKEQKCTTNP